MAEKDGTERRVYVLPTELVERIRAFQASNAITSEVEAVRRLLDSALQMRDTVETILDKLKEKFAGEKDLRVLARDVLTTHSRVRRIEYGDNSVMFVLSDGTAGDFNKDGSAWIREDDNDNWTAYPKPKRSPMEKGGTTKGGYSNDLDDEIPF